MANNQTYHERAIADAKDILSAIQKAGNGRHYLHAGSVEWCPEVGASFVPLGRHGRYRTISFPYTTKIEVVLSTIEEDRADVAHYDFED